MAGNDDQFARPIRMFEFVMLRAAKVDPALLFQARNDPSSRRFNTRQSRPPMRTIMRMIGGISSPHRPDMVEKSVAIVAITRHILDPSETHTGGKPLVSHLVIISRQ